MSKFTGIGQVIAVGDLHGNYHGLRTILLRCGVIDKKERWIARDTHLVQLGDVLGRGGEPGKIFRMLKRLEQEALDAGSRVHFLLGNHEAMSISGMLMYNTVEEFRDLAGEDWLEPAADGASWESHAARAQDGEGRPGRPGGRVAAQRLDMMGAREFRDSLSPEGKVGYWLSTHDSAVSINGFLFVHGGLNRECGLVPLDELNAQVRAELFGGPALAAGKADWSAASARAAPEGGIVLRRDGPQWNREFTLDRNPERQKELEEVLEFHGCGGMVVGHTPTKCIDPSQAGRIMSLYGGKLHCIDTGIGRAYGENLSALKIKGGVVTPIYP
jgi:hypothetical protein